MCILSSYKSCFCLLVDMLSFSLTIQIIGTAHVIPWTYRIQCKWVRGDARSKMSEGPQDFYREKLQNVLPNISTTHSFDPLPHYQHLSCPAKVPLSVTCNAGYSSDCRSLAAYPATRGNLCIQLFMMPLKINNLNYLYVVQCMIWISVISVYLTFCTIIFAPVRVKLTFLQSTKDKNSNSNSNN